MHRNTQSDFFAFDAVLIIGQSTLGKIEFYVIDAKKIDALWSSL